MKHGHELIKVLLECVAEMDHRPTREEPAPVGHECKGGRLQARRHTTQTLVWTYQAVSVYEEGLMAKRKQGDAQMINGDAQEMIDPRFAAYREAYLELTSRMQGVPAPDVLEQEANREAMEILDQEKREEYFLGRPILERIKVFVYTMQAARMICCPGSRSTDYVKHFLLEALRAVV
jgi:hypothetical protein